VISEGQGPEPTELWLLLLLRLLDAKNAKKMPTATVQVRSATVTTEERLANDRELAPLASHVMAPSAQAAMPIRDLDLRDEGEKK
jgi:hypothetical protein